MWIFRDWLWSMKAPRSAAILIMVFWEISHTVLYSCFKSDGISSMFCWNDETISQVRENWAITITTGYLINFLKTKTPNKLAPGVWCEDLLRLSIFIDAKLSILVLDCWTKQVMSIHHVGHWEFKESNFDHFCKMSKKKNAHHNFLEPKVTSCLIRPTVQILLILLSYDKSSKSS